MIKKLNPFSYFAIIYRNNDFILIGYSVVYFLMQFALQDIIATSVLFTEYRYQWDATDIGLYWAFLGILLVVYQGVVLRYILKWMQDKWVLLLGVAISTISHFIAGLAWSQWLFIVVNFFAVAGVLSDPALRAIFSKRVGKEQQGAALGALDGINAVGKVAGGIAAQTAFALSIPSSSKYHIAGMQFIVGGSAYFLATALGLVLIYVSKHEENDDDDDDDGDDGDRDRGYQQESVSLVSPHNRNLEESEEVGVNVSSETLAIKK